MKRKCITALLLAGVMAFGAACGNTAPRLQPSEEKEEAVQEGEVPGQEDGEAVPDALEGLPAPSIAQTDAVLSTEAAAGMEQEDEDEIWTEGISVYSDYLGNVTTYKDPAGRYSMNYETDYFAVNQDGSLMDVLFDYKGSAKDPIFVGVKYYENTLPSSIQKHLMNEHNLHKGEFSDVDFGAESIPALSVNIPETIDGVETVTAYSLLDLGGDTLMVAVKSYPDAPEECDGHIEFLLGTLKVV